MPRCFPMVIPVLALLVAVVPARAVKVLERVTPASAAAQGFTVKVQDRDDGTFGFTITRDLSKSRWPGRDAHLELRGDKGALVKCLLKAEKDRSGKTLAYWFALAKEQVPHTSLTVTEVQTAGNREDGEKLLGGGTYYEFDLAGFAGRAP